MRVIVVYPTLLGNVSELVRISVPPVFVTIRLDSQSVSQSIQCMFNRRKYVCRPHWVWKVLMSKVTRQGNMHVDLAHTKSEK